MKLKNSVLLDKFFLETVISLFKVDIPIKLSYPLKKIILVLEKEEKHISIFRDELYKKYGKEIKNENDEIIGYEIVPLNKEKFANEINDLINLEFEIPIENKIVVDISDSNYDNLKLSSEKILKLENIIEFKM